MKQTLAAKIAASSLHAPIAISILCNELEGMTLQSAALHVEQRTGIDMPSTYSGRRAALRSIGCLVSNARVFKSH